MVDFLIMKESINIRLKSSLIKQKASLTLGMGTLPYHQKGAEWKISLRFVLSKAALSDSNPCRSERASELCVCFLD